MNRADGGSDYVNKYMNIKDWSVETDEERKARTGLSSLGQTDRASAAVQKTPNRVSLGALTEKIVHIEYLHPEGIPHMTIAVVYTQNGFALVGKSAPADPENFNEKLGQDFAFEDAARQLWQLEAYLLRERMTNQG
jgi:hypothetical protein